MHLNFNSAYKGVLHIYALDWDSTARRETISVNGQSAVLGEFNSGAWVSFPINIPPGGTVTITVTRTAGANAVLSGIFLGDAGAPPGPTVSSAPQGAWVGKVGSAGYGLAGWDGSTDSSYLPNASLSLVQGSRYQWAANTTDARALQSPDGLTRNASTYYDPNQIQVKLGFTAAYKGNLHVYAVDWDSTARREIITVNGQSAALGEFNSGAWVSFPIDVAAGGTMPIRVDRTAGANAVLSGIFLGDAGAPPEKGTAHWTPPKTLTWYWQLNGTLAAMSGTGAPARAAAWDVDGESTSAAQVAALHSAGHKAICYVDVGTWEPWRADAGSFPAAVKGSSVEGFAEEKWLDIRALSTLQPIMVKRFQSCKEKGFDAVEPDNMDGYSNASGFPLTAAQQLTYNEWVAGEVHSLGLAVFQKNDGEQVGELKSHFDGVISEQCNQYSECPSFQPYLAEGKPVLNAEYSLATSSFCPPDNAAGIMGARFNVALDGRVYEPC